MRRRNPPAFKKAWIGTFALPSWRLMHRATEEHRAEQAVQPHRASEVQPRIQVRCGSFSIPIEPRLDIGSCYRPTGRLVHCVPQGLRRNPAFGVCVGTAFNGRGRALQSSAFDMVCMRSCVEMNRWTLGFCMYPECDTLAESLVPGVNREKQHAGQRDGTTVPRLHPATTTVPSPAQRP
jgi:hypothetical protein